MGKHAVITPASIVTFEAGRLKEVQYSANGTSLAELASILLDQGFSHAWFMADHGAILPDVAGDEWEFFTPRYTRGREQHLRLVSAKRRAAGQPGRLHIQMIFVEWTAWARSGTRWASQARGKELLCTILYLEKQLGIDVGAGPGGTGWRLLEKMAGPWLADYPAIDLRQHHFTAAAGGDIVWCSPDAAEQCSGGYLHKFDRSMSYPYASSFDNRYGVGTPTLESGEDSFYRRTAGDKIKCDRVGVWRCKIAGHQYAGYPQLYHGEWLSGPYIRILKRLGYRVEIFEGYIFPEDDSTRPHQIMARWSRFMWECRQAFRDCSAWRLDRPRMFAEQSIKLISTATIGSTAFKQYDERTEADKRRPDIRLQTIGRAAELTMLLIIAEHERSGRTPVMVYSDAVYYWSASRDGRGQFTDIVKREGEFGGMRWEGCMEFSPDVAAVFRQAGAISEKLAILNAKGWQQ